MTSRALPRLATILLRGFGPNDDVLTGDLEEEWRAGRSAAWYWRQVLAAVAHHLVAEIRAHWVIVARGVLTFVLVLKFLAPVFGMIATEADRWVSVHVPAYGQMPGYIYMQLQLYSLKGLAIWCLTCIGSGWIVARLHRRHRAAAILGCSVAMISLVVTDVRLQSLVANSFTHERFWPYLLIHFLHYPVGVTGLMTGGLMEAGISVRQPLAR